jgi:hypothetical protein
VSIDSLQPHLRGRTTSDRLIRSLPLSIPHQESRPRSFTQTQRPAINRTARDRPRRQTTTETAPARTERCGPVRKRIAPVQ